MDTPANKILEALAPALSTEIERLLQESNQEHEQARKQLEADFSTRLETAVKEAEAAVRTAAETEKAEALKQAVDQVRSEYTSKGQAAEDHIAAEREQWTAERLQMAEDKAKLDADNRQLKEEMAELQAQSNLWKACALALKQMSESASQPEMLNNFLSVAESVAPDVAVYLAKPDGLELWKSRGSVVFSKMAPKEGSDPDLYLKTVVVRGKTLVAVCARPPYKVEPLDCLLDCLGRAVEAFAMKLKNAPRPVEALSR